MLEKQPSSVNKCFCDDIQVTADVECWLYEEKLVLIEPFIICDCKSWKIISNSFKISCCQFNKHYCVYFVSILNRLHFNSALENSKFALMNNSSGSSCSKKFCNENENQNEFVTEICDCKTKDTDFSESNEYKVTTDLGRINGRCDRINDGDFIENESIQYDGVFDFEVDCHGDLVDFEQRNVDTSCRILNCKTDNSCIPREVERNIVSSNDDVYIKEELIGEPSTSIIENSLYDVQSSFRKMKHSETVSVGINSMSTKSNVVTNFFDDNYTSTNEENFLLPENMSSICHSQPYNDDSNDCSTNLIEDVDSVSSLWNACLPNIKPEFNRNSKSCTNVHKLLEIEKNDLLGNCNMVSEIDKKFAVNEVEKSICVGKNVKPFCEVSQQNCSPNEIIDNCDIKIESNVYDRVSSSISQNLKNYELHNLSIDPSSLGECSKFLNNVSTSNCQFNSGNIINDKGSSKNTSEISSCMTGYGTARNEFDVEFDDNAENVLTYLSNDDGMDNDDLIKQLSFAIISGYNLRLTERLRRKRIVCRYNLINPMKKYLWYNKFKNSFGEKFMKNLFRIFQLMDLEKFEDLLRGLRKMHEIKSHLNKLFEYRQNGMTRLSSVEMFEHLNKQRDESLRMLRCSVPSVTFTDSDVPIISSLSRRPPPPIVITNMPGYSALDETESDFCSVNRILPNSFMQFKEILVNECNKKNGIKLAQARVLLKIDVNKTRKLYDFLMKQKLIWLPHSN